MSTSYNPETDGGSEHTNKTVVQAIRSHVDRNQKGWCASLPQVRFSIMNSLNASTGFSPFQLKSGHSPWIIPALAPTIGGETVEELDAWSLTKKLELDVRTAQDSLTAAKVRQAYHANMHHTAEDVYQIRDRVMLSTTNHHRDYK
jgi:hypothetical protein